ncbi:MAG: SPFH domain-containing protein [Armatimonadetes bacterium]|nr:SPFH domain-containing protein [Armatimonadota bacterium]
MVFFGILGGFLAWFVVRYVVFGIVTVQQNERAVKTIWGKAERLPDAAQVVDSELTDEERERYNYPSVRVLGPGVYFKMPWETIHKVSIATQTVSIALDPEDPGVNHNGTVLEAVTKDQLHVGLTGQIRYVVSEANLYAYLFGSRNPTAHVMGFFHSVLRERIANFEAPVLPGVEPTGPDSAAVQGISINDLRKNLRDINEHMEQECRHAVPRYGIALQAALITGIDPPPEVESALAAINTAHNQVSSEISLAQAAADQKIVQSRRAVEIETLKAQAEVEPLHSLAEQLSLLKSSGPEALELYRRNVRLGLFGKARNVFLEAQHG